MKCFVVAHDTRAFCALPPSSFPTCCYPCPLLQVGTISANGEISIGDIISEAMEKVGKEGVITV